MKHFNATLDYLEKGQALTRNKFIRSQDGRYLLALAGDGDLILHGPSGILWASNTAGKEDVQHVILQHDGNLVMYNVKEQAVWASHTGGQFRARVELVVQNDGNAVIYSDARAIWATHTPGGKKPEALQNGQHLNRDQSLMSKDSRYRLTLGDDGNLVLYGPSGILWASNTAGKEDVQRVALEHDGNLVMYNVKEQAVWASHTGGRARAWAKLNVQNDGNAVIYSDDAPIWATHTVNGKRPEAMQQGQSLIHGQSLISRNGWYRLTLRNDGNLVLSGPPGILWASNTAGNEDVQRVVLEHNGKLVMYSRDEVAVWVSHTGRQAQTQTKLKVQNDGSVVIIAGKKVLWAIRTSDT